MEGAGWRSGGIAILERRASLIRIAGKRDKEYEHSYQHVGSGFCSLRFCNLLRLEWRKHSKTPPKLIGSFALTICKGNRILATAVLPRQAAHDFLKDFGEGAGGFIAKGLRNWNRWC